MLCFWPWLWDSFSRGRGGGGWPLWPRRSRLLPTGMPLGRLATPAATIAACLLVPRYAPVALVLAIPVYDGPTDVIRAALLWLAVSVLMEGLEDRIVDEILPSRVRRMSAQLLSVAVLYYTLLPVMFL